MSDSIYAPPEADVSAPPSDAAPRYYIVAPLKFFLLSIMTLGLYFVYWFYKNWQMIKLRDANDSWPVARAIFYIFFTHSLFTDIDIRAKERDTSYEWSPGLTATLFVVLSIVNNIADRVIPEDALGWWYVIGSLSLVFILPILLFQAQKAINFACNDERGDSNRKITAANAAWLILGALFWLLVIIGMIAIVTPGLLA